VGGARGTSAQAGARVAGQATHRSAGATHGSARVGGVERADLDVGVGDGRIGLLRFDVGRDTRGGWASTMGGTGGGQVGGVGRVEPKHVDVVVIPDGEDKNHALGHGLVHGVKPPLAAKSLVSPNAVF
jgi:hypothetical protein